MLEAPDVTSFRAMGSKWWFCMIVQHARERVPEDKGPALAQVGIPSLCVTLTSDCPFIKSCHHAESIKTTISHLPILL